MVLRKGTVGKYEQDNGQNSLCPGQRRRKTGRPSIVDGFQLNGNKGDG